MLHLCDVCGECFNDEILFFCHQEVYHKLDNVENVESPEIPDSSLPRGSDGRVDYDTVHNDCCSGLNYLESYGCSLCNQIYNDEWLLEAHKILEHNFTSIKSGGELRSGDREVTCNQILASNISTHEADDGTRKERVRPVRASDVDVADALEGAAVRNYHIKNNCEKDLDEFLTDLKSKVVGILKEELTRLNILKFNLVLNTIFTNEENETSKRGFITRVRSQTKCSNLEEMLTLLILKRPYYQLKEIA